MKHWINLDTGELVTKKEMIDTLINEFDFDEFTPFSEVYEYFYRLTDEYLTGVDSWIINEYPAAVNEFIKQF